MITNKDLVGDNILLDDKGNCIPYLLSDITVEYDKKSEINEVMLNIDTNFKRAFKFLNIAPKPYKVAYLIFLSNHLLGVGYINEINQKGKFDIKSFEKAVADISKEFFNSFFNGNSYILGFKDEYDNIEETLYSKIFEIGKITDDSIVKLVKNVYDVYTFPYSSNFNKFTEELFLRKPLIRDTKAFKKYIPSSVVIFDERIAK